MTPDLTLLGIDIYIAPIDRPSDRSLWRQAERQAVEGLVRRVFGPDARYTHHPDGTPAIEGSDCRISVSHGAGMAVLAVGGSERVGVDIEQMRPQLERIAERFLRPDELPTWSNRLLEAWTIKEAVFKAAGIESLVLSDITLLPPPDSFLPTHDSRLPTPSSRLMTPDSVCAFAAGRRFLTATHPLTPTTLIALARRETGVRRQETGDRRQESGVRSQESGVRSQESGVRRDEGILVIL